MKRPLQITVLGLVAAACAAWFLGDRHPPEQRYFASYHLPCGRSTFMISQREAGPFIEVQPEGRGDPSKQLRSTVLVSTKYQLHGWLTGKVIDDGHCGALPEFHVERFEPWGVVVRPFDPQGVDFSGDLFTFTEGQAVERFVAEDFGRGARRLVPETCSASTAPCLTGTVAQTATDERRTRYCCAFAE